MPGKESMARFPVHARKTAEKDKCMKVSIIGAGVSGLSAACYLQMNGFETEIFERQSHPGGLCASWKRGDFTFDCCIHWLLGSNDSSPFYRLWSELVDMQSVEFVNHETRVDIELKENRNRYGDKLFHLWTDINRLEDYLLDLAPEDTALIKSLTKSMRVMQKFEIPPMIENIPALQSWRNRIRMITYLPFVFLYLKWKNVTNYSFARKLKNPFLKEAFELFFDGEEFKLLILTMPLSFYDRKGAGYPVGGSYRFVKRIADKYASLGGRIHYNSPVRKILTDGNKAQGILLEDGTRVLSDITIAAVDWYYTVFQALDGKYVNKKLLALASQKMLQIYPSVFMVSLGVSGTFREYPHLFRYPLDAPMISPDGTAYNRMESHIYHYDPTLAPEGKTILVVSLYTRHGDYWIKLRSSDRDEYIRRKNEFAGEIISRLEDRIKGVTQAIEVIDIATPATFYRYTGNWKGSVQGWFPGSNLLSASPVKMDLPGLSNFYLCSHWLVPGGGLPIAIKSGRDLTQKICMKYKKTFSIR
jgi:phytoene dehydrogenase-like protein